MVSILFLFFMQDSGINAESIKLIANAVIFYNATLLSNIYEPSQWVLNKDTGILIQDFLKYLNEFREYEKEAKEYKRGLWGEMS